MQRFLGCRMLILAALAWPGAAHAAGQAPDGNLNASGAPTANELAPITGASALGSAAGFVRLAYPVAVAASGPDIYIADSGLNRIFRYDRASQTLQPFAGLQARQDTRLAMGADLSLYVLESLDRRIAHYSRNGTLLRTYADDANLGRPVAFAVDEASGKLWVADGLYNQLVVFNMRGRIAEVVRLPAQMLSIGDLAFGRGIIHVLDTGNGQVLSLSPDGRLVSMMGRDSLKQPVALAADRQGRLYVADIGSRRIHAFATDGQPQLLPVHINAQGGIAIDEGRLYVADPLQARIRVILIMGGG